MMNPPATEPTSKPWPSFATPLLAQALKHKGETVAVYIAGGIRVDGKLREVDEDTLVLTIDDEDLVLTIDDRTHRHYVAIESIAVLAVER